MKKYLPLLRFLLIACISAFLAWKGQPFVHGNEKAVDLIINVFAILAGFLIAIMTLFSDMRLMKMQIGDKFKFVKAYKNNGI